MKGETDLLQVDKLNLRAISKKKNLSGVILEYLLYVECNPKKALELTLLMDPTWWWKLKQGIYMNKID